MKSGILITKDTILEIYDALGLKAAPIADARYKSCVPRLVEELQARLK